jgi:hypothetical protein
MPREALRAGAGCQFRRRCADGGFQPAEGEGEVLHRRPWRGRELALHGWARRVLARVLPRHALVLWATVRHLRGPRPRVPRVQARSVSHREPVPPLVWKKRRESVGQHDRKSPLPLQQIGARLPPSLEWLQTGSLRLSASNDKRSPQSL